MSYPNTEPGRWTVYRITHDVAADTAERAISLSMGTPLTEIRAFDADVITDVTAAAEELVEVRAAYDEAEKALAHSRWRYHQILRWLTGTYERCKATAPMGNYQCLLAEGHHDQADSNGAKWPYHTDGSSNW